MNLKEIAEGASLENLTPEIALDDAAEVKFGYASDMLSDVLAYAERGGILVTVQVHANVVAVAMHTELAAVVFTSGRRPDAIVRDKAVEEGIALFASESNTFDVVCRLGSMGLRGSHE